MQRWLNLVRQMIMPKLCRHCRSVVDKAVDDFPRLRAEHRRLAFQARRQRGVAIRDCDRLLAYPPEEQFDVIERSRSTYRTRPLVDELLRRSQRQIHRCPREALHLARLGEAVARQIYGLHLVAGGLIVLPDLKARSLAHQANTLRVLGKPQESEELFRKALQEVLRGTREPEVEAEVLSLHSSLLRDCSRFEEALQSLERAEELYRRAGEEHLRGRAMMLRSLVLQDMNDPDAARPVLEAALELLEPTRDRLLVVTGFRNLADLHCDIHRFLDAARALDSAAEALGQRSLPPENLRSHWRWTQAKIARGFDQPQKAERLLQKVLAGFAGLENPFKTALVSLDLASLLLEQNRLDELAAIAENTYRNLCTQNLEPEAEQCLEIFVEAARRRQVAVEMIQAVVLQVSLAQSRWRAPPFA